MSVGQARGVHGHATANGRTMRVQSVVGLKIAPGVSCFVLVLWVRYSLSQVHVVVVVLTQHNAGFSADPVSSA